MVSKSPVFEADAPPTEVQLKDAADRARAAVAAAPRDEAAAIELYRAARAYRDAFPPASEEGEVKAATDVAEARRLIDDNDLEAAETLLRKHLGQHPNDHRAMHMMGEIAAYCGLPADADRILRHSAQAHANDPDALTHLAATFHRIGVREDVPQHIYLAAQAFDRVLQLDPGNLRATALKAAMMMQTRGLDQAHEAYRQLIERAPNVAAHWLNYGYLLKTLGQEGEGLAAIRTALALDPDNGSSWWTLADLKIARLFPVDVAEMQQALERGKMTDTQRVPLHFALAKALDSAGQYEGAIGHIERGGEVRLSIQKQSSDPLVPGSAFIRKTFTREFFEAREGWGDQRSGPIFILGMHRAGSTLIEQILSSHSQIEGSEELFVITKFANELATVRPGGDHAATIAELSDDEFKAFGQRYFDMSSRSRQTDRPYLTDKYPGNWKFVGLIHCMLPNARIIDVRRNPMDCCFANYFRYYGTAVNHSFSQSGMGHYYADYVAAMRHFDAVLPGRVHRVIHDDLVDDLEGEVRRLLDYIGVPFDENCLRFFETKRAVHTPSAEQVRQPINRSGFGRWRNYAPWLGELQDSLGATLDDWR